MVYVVVYFIKNKMVDLKIRCGARCHYMRKAISIADYTRLIKIKDTARQNRLNQHLRIDKTFIKL